MKIFFFTTVFYPSVGGIETLAELLCREFVALGHDVRLATLTPGEGEFPFLVIRQPTLREFYRELRWCDVHIQANLSLKYIWPAVVANRKTILQHNTAYQWDNDISGPLNLVKKAIACRVKGIANSSYTARKTRAENTILNAYDDELFKRTRAWDERRREIVFVGRLVSQKGCNTLIEAVARLADFGLYPEVTVVGDGPDRRKLEHLARQLRVATQVSFEGKRTGSALVACLNRHQIIAVPSRYEEPFGIVALEGLACGCFPVVSERGGLSDATGGYGLTFPNGDAEALAHCLAQALAEPNWTRAQMAGVGAHLARCRARAVAEKYLEVFSQAVRR